MRWAFAAFMALHGLIHFMGPVKAFGLAQLPQLTQPISRPLGVAWLLAGALVVGAMPAMFLWPRGWWAIGLAAVVLSQIVIVFAWTDAKFGTVANVLLLAVVVHGFLTQGPTSFRAAYEEEAATGLAHAAAAPVVTEADLAPLPEPVQRYFRATGVVGQPRARSYRLRFTGRIRGAALLAGHDLLGVVGAGRVVRRGRRGGCSVALGPVVPGQGQQAGGAHFRVAGEREQGGEDVSLGAAASGERRVDAGDVPRCSVVRAASGVVGEDGDVSALFGGEGLAGHRSTSAKAERSGAIMPSPSPPRAIPKRCSQSARSSAHT